MTIRWKPGKQPTQKEMEELVTNSLNSFKLNKIEITTIATRVLKFVNDRIERRS